MKSTVWPSLHPTASKRQWIMDAVPTHLKATPYGASATSGRERPTSLNVAGRGAARPHTAHHGVQYRSVWPRKSSRRGLRSYPCHVVGAWCCSTTEQPDQELQGALYQGDDRYRPACCHAHDPDRYADHQGVWRIFSRNTSSSTRTSSACLELLLLTGPLLQRPGK